MASNASTGAPAEQTLFVRKASGLVKGWSTTDGFRYSFFSTNVFLGIWGFLYAVFIPGGSVFWAVILSPLLVLLEVVVYAGLISAMPRAGGDYVWQSRVFHSSVGFVMGATGWWFILWLWIPIYAALCVNSFIKPSCTSRAPAAPPTGSASPSASSSPPWRRSLWRPSSSRWA